jgi:hypothetical protein
MKDFGDQRPIEKVPVRTQPISDDELVGYLLGTLRAEEADRLDERSIVEDDLAERLRMVEDALVDSYAAGTLKGERLQRFESFYLSSPRRRRKAAFAQGLISAVERSTRQPTILRKTWPHAAAAALILAAAMLGVQNLSLRHRLRTAEDQATVARERTAATSEQLVAEREAAAAARQALADARKLQPLSAIALVLLPQTRGVAPVPAVAIASTAADVPLELALETAPGTSYTVTLRDPVTNLTAWRSPPVGALRARGTPVVAFSLPARLLKPQHYALDLFELGSGKAPEFVSSYAFEVVRR